MKVDVIADLEALLYHYDEVQIPSLGVISTRQNDFSIDRGAGSIYPSAKRVHTFDRIIHTNNNALVNFIAHKYGMSYDEAHQTVQEFADNYADTLKSKGLNIPSIGHLSMNEDGQVQFEPNNRQNYSVENYGLPILKDVHPVLFERQKNYEKVEKEQPKTQVKSLEPKKEQLPVPAKSYLALYAENRMLQLLTIIVLLLATTIPLTQRYIANTSNSNNAGIALPANPNLENTNDSEYNENLDDDDGFVNVTPNSGNEEVKEETVEETPPVVEQPTPKPVDIKPKEPEQPKVRTSTGETHNIVLGAFGNKDNAEKLQLDIYSKGYKNASITKLSNGFYRVAIVLDCPKGEVNDKLREIKRDYENAWWMK